MVLSRDAPTAFDMLWMLGAGLSVLGRHVVALDATSRENEGRAGLHEQLMSSVQCFSKGDDSWRILPAQIGLEGLLQTASQVSSAAALTRLAAQFSADTVVLVLAPKEWLCVLFEESGAHPLIPFALEPAGVVDAYSATKVMVQAGGMSPVLVPVTGDGPELLEHQGLLVLLETARNHLGQEPECWPMPDIRPGESRDRLSQWMLRIADNALLLNGPSAPGGSWTTPNQREAFVPQLWSC